MPDSEIGSGPLELFAPAGFSTRPPDPSIGPTPPTSTTPAAVLPVAPEPNEPICGQLLLGTDKRNPVFLVYEDRSGEWLLVYYGFEFFERVPYQREYPAFKLLLGRLHNAGLNRRALSETFGVDAKTIRRWGEGLLQSDPVELIRVLEGRAAGRKRTLAVERFARLRWPYLVAEGSYGAVGRLLREIESVLEVRLSRSGAKELIRELKNPPQPAVVAAAVVISEVETATLRLEIRETGTQCSLAGSDATRPERSENKGVSPTEPPPPPNPTAQASPFFPRDPADALYWCDHAGVLIFAAALASISKVSGTPHPILAQWISALWLGAHNLEQTKFLNWEDLQLILGGVVRFPSPQRQQLKLLAADPAVIDGLWRFNQEILEPGTDLYFDPHTKHYTGEQNVLKGWCSKIRFADKILNSDFIHTSAGAPIYFETTDNFADLRQRFFTVTAAARQALQWPQDRVITYVVDRGIYGEDVFERVIADPTLHLITWQKGFVAEAWDSAQATGRTSISRVRNYATDLRTSRFEYIDRTWAKNPGLRQIVVHATSDTGRTIQVAILTDDLTRPAAEIIHLIFRRWLQENDFKYLDKHFGINQITSYRSIEYQELKGQVEDREVKSAARRALELSLQGVKEQLKRHLLAEEQALRAQTLRGLRRTELQAQWSSLNPSDTPEALALKRQLAAIGQAELRYEVTRAKRRQSIDQIHLQSVGLQMQLGTTAATESRLEALVAAQMVKLDGHSKRLMDVLRITARNLFYRALGPFKKAYDNYRDDHEHFRLLTQSPGVLEIRGDHILIHLMPKAHYGGDLRQAVIAAMDQLNAEGLEHPFQPGRKLKFRLGHRSEMEVKMNPAP